MKNRFLLFTLAGVLLALSFPPIPFWMFAFVAFIPLLIAFENSTKKLFWLTYFTFFIYHGGTNWWISSWQTNTDPFLFASGIAVWLVHPLFFTLPIFIQNYFNKKIGFQKAIWLFPLVWTLFEWWHSLGDLSYPWMSIGYSQIYNKYFSQIADLGGVWLISFIIVLVNVIFYKIYYYFFFERNFNKIKYLSLILITLFLSIYIYGIIQFNKYNSINDLKPEDKITVGIIQPNINPWEKWEGFNSLEMIGIHRKIQDSLHLLNQDIDLFIWSETALTYLNNEINAKHNFSFIQEWVNNTNTSVLTGFADFKYYEKGEQTTPTTKYFLKDTNRPYDSYNACVIVNYDTTFKIVDNIYHKMKLTPFSEYLPYPEYITFLKNFVEWGVGISSWGKGTNQRNLLMDNGKKQAVVSPIICIESIYPGFIANFSKMNNDFMALITNDAWYDYTFGPEQHFAIAEMRAIENRKYIARCANTGISGVINRAGIRTAIATQYQRTGLLSEVYKSKETSIYVKFGDIIPYISLFFIGGLWFFLIFKKIKK